MKIRYILLVVTIAISILLVGCAKQEPAPETEAAPVGGAAGPTGGLQGANRLALGTLRLEDTGNAVTPAQAAELLPLWRMIESGSLTSETETNAVLKQIEGAMSGPQLAAINAIELEGGDVQAWMQEQGLAMPAPPASQGDSAGQGGPGGPGALQNLSEEERAKMREEFSSMTAEERATRMASLPSEARGIQRPEGEAGARPGGMGQFNALFGYLVEFLMERAAA